MKAILDRSDGLYRVTYLGEYGDARNGCAMLRLPTGALLRIIFSDQDEWDHVSVSLVDRCPTWQEMCEVKRRFFEPDDCVVQYHPPESTYVNDHPYCLHLWRPTVEVMPRPPLYMV